MLLKGGLTGFQRGNLKWLILGSTVGVLCGVVGIIFHVCVDLLGHFFINIILGLPFSGPQGEHSLFHQHGGTFHPWLVPLVLGFGGLVVGLMTTRWAKDAPGEGLEVVVDAYHRKRGRLGIGATVTKLAASVVTLSTGGSAGREGPIAMAGAGFAALASRYFRLTGRDRRILLAAGIGGGIAAVFRTPLAGALFAAEVLYSDPEMDAEVLIPSFITAIVGFVVFGLLEQLIYPSGHGEALGALFATAEGLSFTMAHVLELVGYGLIAVVIAVAARLHASVVHRTENSFHKLPVPVWVKPAIGGLLAGTLGVLIWKLSHLLNLAPVSDPNLALSTLGSGYGILQDGLLQGYMDGPIWSAAVLLVIIAVAKVFTSSLTVSSGGAGGLFAPSIVIGGCIGGAIGTALQGTPIAPPIGACVLMGMAGFFSTAYRTPIAALLMVSELTGNYLLLLPAMWVCALAMLINNRFTLIKAQVPEPVNSPAHRGHFFNDILTGIPVSSVFDRERSVRTLKPHSSIDECKTLVTECNQTVYPVVGDKGRLVGIFNMNDLRSFLYDETLGLVAVAEDVATEDIIVVRETDSLASAMRRFTAKNLEELPVVEDRNGYQFFLGLLSRRQVIHHYNGVVADLRRQRAEDGYEEHGHGSRGQFPKL